MIASGFRHYCLCKGYFEAERQTLAIGFTDCTLKTSFALLAEVALPRSLVTSGLLPFAPFAEAVLLASEPVEEDEAADCEERDASVPVTCTCSFTCAESCEVSPDSL